MYSDSYIKERIKTVLIETLELNLGKNQIGDGVPLNQLFGFDSVAVIEFVLGLEKAFSIVIPPESLEFDVISDLDKLSSHIGLLIADKS
jgi:acyl carrier protein